VLGHQRLALVLVQVEEARLHGGRLDGVEQTLVMDTV
jgi:hypothetical protein